MQMAAIEYQTERIKLHTSLLCNFPNFRSTSFIQSYLSITIDKGICQYTDLMPFLFW